MASIHPENMITAEELKDVLMDVLLAAGGCLKARPSLPERARLRRSLRLAMTAHKRPVCLHLRQVPPEGQKTGQTDPVRLVADYVESGGNWQALIAAITSRGRSGMTKPETGIRKGFAGERSDSEPFMARQGQVAARVNTRRGSAHGTGDVPPLNKQRKHHDKERIQH